MIWVDFLRPGTGLNWGAKWPMLLTAQSSATAFDFLRCKIAQVNQQKFEAKHEGKKGYHQFTIKIK
jgi:hypothetical protein